MRIDSPMSHMLSATVLATLSLAGIGATVAAQSFSSQSSSSSSSLSSSLGQSSSFSFSQPVQQFLPEQAPITFRDVPDDAWYKDYVDQASRAGVVNGYKDEHGDLTGFFGPNDKLTFAQSVKIALESAGYDVSPQEYLLPVGEHWSKPYIDKARELQFQAMATAVTPDQPATRAVMASLFADAFRVAVAPEIMGATARRYRDLGPQILFAESIAVLSQDGIVNGDTDDGGNPTGTVRPNDTIVRAEAVKMAVLARAKYGLPGSGIPSQLPDAGFPPVSSESSISSLSSSTVSSISSSLFSSVSSSSSAFSFVSSASSQSVLSSVSSSSLSSFTSLSSSGMSSSFNYFSSLAPFYLPTSQSSVSSSDMFSSEHYHLSSSLTVQSSISSSTYGVSSSAVAN